MNKQKPPRELSSDSDEENQHTLKKRDQSKKSVSESKSVSSESSSESAKKKLKKPLPSKRKDSPDPSKNNHKKKKGKNSSSHSSESESSDNGGKQPPLIDNSKIGSKNISLKTKKKKNEVKVNKSSSESESNNLKNQIIVQPKRNIKVRRTNLESSSDASRDKNKKITDSDESNNNAIKPKINRGKIVLSRQTRKSSSSSVEIPKTKLLKGKILDVKKNKKNEKDSEEEVAQTLKKINKKTRQNKSDEDNAEMTLMIKKDLPLKMVHIQTKKEFTIAQDLTVIRRKSENPNDIVFEDKILGINDQEISRKQCEFKQFQKGFAISDKGSSNGTYLMLKKDYQTLVYPGMILEVGEFFLEINKLTAKTIHWQLHQDQDEESKEEIEKKVSNFKNKNKIKFGKNPGDSNDIKIDDSEILDVQGYFEKKDDAIYVIVCNDKSPFWLKIKDRNYILTKNMIIKLTQNHQLNITQIGNIKLKKCTKCEETADLVFYPCLHNAFCSECIDNKLKKCPECKKEINSMEIYYDATGNQNN